MMQKSEILVHQIWYEMSRKRQRAGLFNHAAATKKKGVSEKGQVVQKAGIHLHICFNMNTDARYLAKLVQKVGLEWQANNESVPL